MLAATLAGRRHGEPARRHASGWLPAALAALIVVGTFLPWRVTAGGASNGWRTADLALALAETGDGTRLRLVVLAWFLMPVVAVAAALAMLAVGPPVGVLVSRLLSGLALLAAAGTSAGLRSAPGAAFSPIGPTFVVVVSAALFIVCCTTRRGATLLSTSEDVST